MNSIAPERDTLQNVAFMMVAEYMRARESHPPMHGPHEGYAVILEEVDELWDEVRRRHHSKFAMWKEALQIGAMAMAFIIEVAGAYGGTEGAYGSSAGEGV